MFYITFNGISSNELGVAVTTRPDIPAPTLRGEYIDIPGRDGSLFQTDGTYENIEISVALNFIRPRNELGALYRRVKSWINGSGVLRMSDDSGVFYRVKYSGISDAKRRSRYGCDIVAVFICEPFQYLDEGTAEIVPLGTVLNPYYTARPKYIIEGAGTATLTVNGKTIRATVSEKMTIDTSLMIAYREGGTLVNTAIVGDYDDLVLVPGENTVSISSGFNLRMIPNYRSL